MGMETTGVDGGIAFGSRSVYSRAAAATDDVAVFREPLPGERSREAERAWVVHESSEHVHGVCGCVRDAYEREYTRQNWPLDYAQIRALVRRRANEYTSARDRERLDDGCVRAMALIVCAHADSVVASARIPAPLTAADAFGAMAHDSVIVTLERRHESL